MQVVVSDPFNKVVMAKNIGEEYGIDYYAAIGMEKPTSSVTPGEHKIKKFGDLRSAMLGLDLDYWKDLCRMLNVDDAVIDDLKTFKTFFFL